MKLNWKRVSLLTLLMGTCFTAGVVASNGIVKVQAFLRPDFKVYVDGKEVALSVPPLIYEDRSYLPLKTIGELLNAEINWQDRTKSIYVNPRFAGQPVIPSTGGGNYPLIKLQQPFAYNVGYLGGNYALLSITYNQETFFRVRDLALMGIDTGGIAKSKEQYTGELYVKPEEVRPLWKQYPNMGYSLDPIVAGVGDEGLKTALIDYAQTSIPVMIQHGYLPLPKGSQVYFIDKLPGETNLFAYYIYSMTADQKFLIVQMEQDDKGKWSSRSVQGIGLDGLGSYYK